jgi:HAD superfamily hydrolase (TIGR01509 family)
MKLPRPPSAVVFDMDGLLFDTERLYERAAIAAAAELGYELDSAFHRTTVGSSWEVIRGLLLDRYGGTFAAEDLRATARRIFGELLETEPLLKPGVLELLDLLDRLGLPRAIATTSSRPTVQRHLEDHDLVGRFHHVVAHGDYARHKPAPDPFLAAAERLGVAPQLCVALEDSHNGVRAASAAGMMTVMVPDLLPPTEEIRALCTHIVRDLHDVRRLLHPEPVPAHRITGPASREP